MEGWRTCYVCFSSPFLHFPFGCLWKHNAHNLIFIPIRQGAFNDNDMLECCNGHQTQAEYRSQFSTWSILTSPLILGNDIRKMTKECTDVIMNKWVINVNLLKWGIGRTNYWNQKGEKNEIEWRLSCNQRPFGKYIWIEGGRDKRSTWT